MALIKETLPNIYDGVSQQPPTLRSKTQAEAQENALSSLVDGVVKRPPSSVVASYSWDTWVAGGDNVYVHWINKNKYERYVAFLNDQIKVYSVIDGLEKTGTINVDGYISSANPRLDIKPVTIADYTIIINKTKNAALLNSQTSGSFTQVNTYADLPSTVDTNYYQIMGSGNGNFDDYWVKGNGSVWIESAKPGLYNYISSVTMPHALIRQSDGTFDYEQLVWEDRLVGDDDSNPIPSFIGNTIDSGFFYKNRLGFISNQNTVMSASGEFFNFWKETARALVDSDPIDVSSSNPKASSVDHAVAMDEALILFSQETQLTLSSDDVLTPKSVSIDVSTQFQVNTDCEPVASGSNIYFATDNGSFSGIREYFVDSAYNTRDAADITAHVPDYVSSQAHKIIPATNQDMLFVLTRDEPNVIYVYKYYWAGDDKLQSSWSKWVFEEGCVIHSGSVMDAKLYLAIQYNAGAGVTSTMSIEAIDLLGEITDGSLDFTVMLDRKVNVTGGTYDSGNNETTWTLPYYVSGNLQACLGSTAGADAGKNLELTSVIVDSNVIKASGDWSAADIYVGIPYTMRYELSPQYVRDQQKSVVDGRLQLKDMTVNYVDSGYFKAKVTPEGRDPYEYVSTAMKIGKENLILGTPVFGSGEFRFPIQSNAQSTKIELINDSFLPSKFQSLHWVGWFHSR